MKDLTGKILESRASKSSTKGLFVKSTTVHVFVSLFLCNFHFPLEKNSGILPGFPPEFRRIPPGKNLNSAGIPAEVHQLPGGIPPVILLKLAEIFHQNTGQSPA